VKLVFTNGDGIQSERIVNLGGQRGTTSVRDAWIKEFLDASQVLLARSGAMSRATAESELRKQIVVPQYIPEIEAAFLGRDGSVWLRRHTSNEWIIVSPSGAVAGRVQVPADVRVTQVSMDQLWGITRDADGLPIVIRYKVS
jgi:hypothetical protein